MKKPWIVSAAVKVEFETDVGNKVLVLCGPRHWDLTMRIVGEMIPKFVFNRTSTTQGFVDQFGNFLTREEAWIIAKENDQIKYRVGGDEVTKDGKTFGKLFSENLY